LLVRFVHGGWRQATHAPGAHTTAAPSVQIQHLIKRACVDRKIKNVHIDLIIIFLASFSL
jgi:hypothetical protein